MERIADALVIVDGSEQITFVNETARRLFGSQLVGQNISRRLANSALLHPDDTPYAPEEIPIRRALGGETVIDAEWKSRIADGRVAIFQGSASPVDAVDGRRIGAVMAFRDITAQRQAQERLRQATERFTKAFASSPVALTITRRKYCVRGVVRVHSRRAPRSDSSRLQHLHQSRATERNNPITRRTRVSPQL
jgi:PAS domain S-box-containing protein